MKRASLALIVLLAAGGLWAEDLAPAVRTSTAAEPTRGEAMAPQPARSAITAPASTPIMSGARVLDRVELENTQITGNRELPKVMYVVPWKKPGLGEFAGRPPKSLLDELLTPVDRDVFKRQNRYFSALQPDKAGGATAPAVAGKESSGAAAPSAGDEK